jgi:predicted transcriptional regulator YheO
LNRRSTIYINDEDAKLIEEICPNLSVSRCFKKLLREYAEISKRQELEKKIDEILTLLKSQQNNTRQHNTLDTYLKKHK